MITVKLDVEKLSVLYDRIYDIADRLFKKYNPCDIRIENNKVLCACKLHTTYRQKALCCQRTDGINCKYWLDGCTVKCLPCKLFVCNYIIYDCNRKYKNFVHRLEWLRDIAIKHSILTRIYFNTKNEVLDISRKQRRY